MVRNNKSEGGYLLKTKGQRKCYLTVKISSTVTDYWMHCEDGVLLVYEGGMLMVPCLSTSHRLCHH